jgi:hypothetical protein
LTKEDSLPPLVNTWWMETSRTWECIQYSTELRHREALQGPVILSVLRTIRAGDDCCLTQSANTRQQVVSNPGLPKPNDEHS